MLLHSRRAFSGISNANDLHLVVVKWAIQSMEQHHINRVIFALHDDRIVGLITRPKAWPSFRFHSVELTGCLAAIEWWRIVKEDSGTNRGAFLIAQSVIKTNQLQSYVAAGQPRWLDEIFDSEKL